LFPDQFEVQVNQDGWYDMIPQGAEEEECFVLGKAEVVDGYSADALDAFVCSVLYVGCTEDVVSKWVCRGGHQVVNLPVNI
jgi:hypothetical protein